MTTRNARIWFGPPPVSPSETLIQVVGGHPLVARILAQRGITTPDAARAFLSPDAYAPAPPSDLPDLVLAAEHLDHAIQRGQTILVWGDFDVDGQTATGLLVDALRGLGADVPFYIPHRLRESHGIQVASLQARIDDLHPAILLTCDTGVSADPAIDYAKSRGLVTLITDHHDLPPALPDANAIVNPKRLPGDHPLAALPGVGVAYKLVEYLYAQAGRAGELPRFLDLVALGVVADVAQQTHDTRYLLQLGLDQLRATQRTGLQMLVEVAGLAPERLTAADIAFQLGPRLNAAGRLDDARPVVELLTTSDRSRAHVLALQLEGLNNQRRLQNSQIYAAALEEIARDPSLLDWEALVLARPGWHAGIIGIVASHLAERYQRPVVLLSIAEDGTARGSARSAPGYDIGAAITAQADLLITFGGHPGAAGLSLPADHIPAFRRRLSDTLHETRDPTVRAGLSLDATLPLSDVTLDLAADLNRLAPFGEGNPRITLASRDLTLRSAALLGRTRAHRRLTVEDASGTRQTVLWWQSADQPLPDDLFDLAYQLEISTYQGETELQLLLVDHRRSENAPVELERPPRQVIDHRADPHPDRVLRSVLEQHPDAAVWAEGYRRTESPGVPLDELRESDTLVVYTAPFGPQALQEALENVQPASVVLLGVNPPNQAFADVQRRLLELVKYVLNHQDGETSLGALAVAVGQSPQTVHLALEYVAARGEIAVDYQDGDALTITRLHETPSATAEAELAAFKTAVAETAAYRAFFRRAAPSHILGEDTHP